MRKNKSLKYCLVMIICLNFSVMANAQESMMPDISYSYLQKLIDTAKKYYPKVQMFDHRANIANVNIQKAKLAWFDLFTFSYLYSPSNSTTLVNPSFLNGYQFGIFFNFFSLFTKGKSVKQAKEELVITKLEKAEYIMNIEAEVKMRYFKYVQKLTTLKIRAQAAVDAENIMKQIQHRFERSEDSYENFNKFSEAYADRRQSSVEAEADLLIAKSSLEEMLGKKLEDIK